MRYVFVFCYAALGMGGCQTLHGEKDVPAIITSPDEASRTALQTTINGLFGGQDVMIADDALTTSSVLAIEFGPRGSLENLPATGRRMDQPLRFRLVRNGGNCFLIDPRDDSRHILIDTRCEPE